MPRIIALFMCVIAAVIFAVLRQLQAQCARQRCGDLLKKCVWFRILNIAAAGLRFRRMVSDRTELVLRILAVPCLLIAPAALPAQTAHFAGWQNPLGSGLSVPGGVAVDANGNVYIADSGNNRVLVETLSAGTYTQTAPFSGLSNPRAWRSTPTEMCTSRIPAIAGC